MQHNESGERYKLDGKAFPSVSSMSVHFVVPWETDWLGRASLGEGYSPYLDKAYTLTDVLLCDPHTTDVLAVLYHVV